MQPREILLQSSADILNAAIEYHDRAMDVFEQLDPDDGALDFGVVGSALDFADDSDWQPESPDPQPQNTPPNKTPKPKSAPSITLQDIQALAGNDDPAQWVPIVRRVVSDRTVLFDDVVAITGLRRVEVWMACLLGGFGLIAGDDFYGTDLRIQGHPPTWLV
jgi:hypothetical protein